MEQNIVIDRCSHACSRACLNNHGIKPDLHFELTGYGVKKQNHVDFDKEQAEGLLEMVVRIEENILTPELNSLVEKI